MPLDQLLETIQLNLADKIDSFYNRTKKLIGKEKEHNLGFLKEKLKGQIEIDFKIVIQNIIHYTRNLLKDDIWIYKLCWKNEMIQMLNEAIKK